MSGSRFESLGLQGRAVRHALIKLLRVLRKLTCGHVRLTADKLPHTPELSPKSNKSETETRLIFHVALFFSCAFRHSVSKFVFSFGQ